jgi:hypothetical protein
MYNTTYNILEINILKRQLSIIYETYEIVRPYKHLGDTTLLCMIICFPKINFDNFFLVEFVFILN